MSLAIAMIIFRMLRRLFFLSGPEGQLGQLCDPIHRQGHFVAELGANRLYGHPRVLHHVVKKGRVALVAGGPSAQMPAVPTGWFM